MSAVHIYQAYNLNSHKTVKKEGINGRCFVSRDSTCLLVPSPSSSAGSLLKTHFWDTWELTHASCWIGKRQTNKNVPSLSILLGYITGTVTDPIKLHPFEKTQWLILMNFTQHSSSGPFLLSINCPKYSSDFLQICPGTGQISNFGR